MIDLKKSDWYGQDQACQKDPCKPTVPRPMPIGGGKAVEEDEMSSMEEPWLMSETSWDEKYCTILFNLNLGVMCDVFGPIQTLEQGIEDVWRTKKFEPQNLESASIVQLHNENLEHFTPMIEKLSISSEIFKF